MMAAAFLDVLGWGRLTAAEQAAALAGACLGLAGSGAAGWGRLGGWVDQAQVLSRAVGGDG